ncbi:MAG: hypothetical protein ABI129_08365 [Rhodanobacter sp.]
MFAGVIGYLVKANLDQSSRRRVMAIIRKMNQAPVLMANSEAGVGDGRLDEVFCHATRAAELRQATTVTNPGGAMLAVI